MNPVEARELAVELQRRRFQGDDERSQIAFISNRLRVGKTEARELNASFERGARIGTALALKIKSEDIDSAANDDPLTAAAIELFTEAFTTNNSSANTSRTIRYLIFILIIVIALLKLVTALALK